MSLGSRRGRPRKYASKEEAKEAAKVLRRQRYLRNRLPAPSGLRFHFEQLDMPLEKRNPASTQHLTQTIRNPHTPSIPASQCIVPPPRLPPHHTTPQQPSEQQSRTEAAQDVQEYSRSSLQQQKTTRLPETACDADPNAVDQNAIPSSGRYSDGATELNGTTITTLPNPDSAALATLIDQASQLTSLLQSYAQSTDQIGLRGDIARLATVQTKHLANWLRFEAGQSRKMGRPYSLRIRGSAATSPAKDGQLLSIREAEEREERDRQIRELLSASAALWQDGSGLGVADVYA